jgi:hypothetical protein
MAWTLLSVRRFATSLGNEVLEDNHMVLRLCNLEYLFVSCLLSSLFSVFEAEGVKYDSSSYFTVKEDKNRMNA